MDFDDINQLLQLAEHLQAYHNKWLRNVNEKNSVAQALTKIKALQDKCQNPERSAAAPTALQHQVPIHQHELLGQVAQPHLVLMSEYQPVVFEEHVEPHNVLDNSHEGSQHHPSSPSAILANVCGSGLEPPRTLGAASKKCKGDTSLHNEQPQKFRHCTCQKCGKQECAGGANRKYCTSPCQDCGKMECKGRNSHHPKKSCEFGWKHYHQKLKL
jgi:hypothetical protein